MQSTTKRSAMDMAALLACVVLLVIALIIGSMWWNLLTNPPKEQLATMPSAAPTGADGNPISEEDLFQSPEMDRSNVEPLPAVEIPTGRSTDLTPVETDFGYTLSLPDWVEQYENTYNEVIFAAPGVWLKADRDAIDPDYPPSIENSMIDFEAAAYPDLETTGDDGDYTISGINVETQEFRVLRIVSGESDFVSVEYRVDARDQELVALGKQIAETLKADPGLDEPFPPAETTLLDGPIVDVNGWFEAPQPEGFEQVYRRPNDFRTFYNDGMTTITITHTVTEGPLTLNEAVAEGERFGYEIGDSGEPADGELYWAGVSSSFSAYKHYFVGENGYVSVNIDMALEASDQERADAQAALDTILPAIRIAPLD